jgi:large subunit ribosomal protein L1
MGKVRVKSFGDEEVEKKDLKKAEARAEAKKAKEAAAERQKAAEVAATPTDKKDKKEVTSQAEETAQPEKKEAKKPMRIKSTGSKQTHSEKYLAVAKEVDRTKKYVLADALTLLAKVKYTNFDETVELHINTTERGVSGSVTLPHGTGKETRVVIANQSADPKHVEELIAEIESGQINFDVLIATPDTMPKLAKIARVLGPRGLMPNPKNGTVTPKPEEIAKKFAGGQINFKTEPKFPLLHMSVGKLSFGDKKLADNIKTAVKAVQAKQVRNITLKSTMSPGIKLDTASL